MCVGVGILSDIGEFIKKLVEFGKVAPLDALAVVVAGAFGVGWLARWRYGKLRADPKQPDPKPEPPQEDPMAVHVRRLRAVLAEDADHIWQFQKSIPPIDALKTIHASKTKIVALITQKGGVAKTTTTVNMAAYFARRGKKVLVVVLDYQGSATAALTNAARLAPIKGAPLNELLLGQGFGVIDKCIGLPGALNNITLLPADDNLNRAETRALLDWLLAIDPQYDVRTRMVNFFASSEFAKRQFDIVLIDTPPRLTVGVMNGLIGATHFVIPTILDNLAIGNVGVLLKLTIHQFRQTDQRIGSPQRDCRQV